MREQRFAAAPPAAPNLSGQPSRVEDDALLEDLSKRSFLFFWEQADPAHRNRA